MKAICIGPGHWSSEKPLTALLRLKAGTEWTSPARDEANDSDLPPGGMASIGRAGSSVILIDRIEPSTRGLLGAREI